MDELPDDPFDNRREGTNFLRLTNECPEKGLIVRIESFKKVHNDKFKKDEYHWGVTHFTPHPIEKIITESSKGFCTALSGLGLGSAKDLIGKVIKIHWITEQISNSKSMKVWNIKLVEKDDLKNVF